MPEYKPIRRGRFKQMPIYLGKFFRMFIYKNDWKVLPMAALIAAIVAFVAGDYMFVNMEGTMMGSMALTCVCLWNGCFNSIQSVCRERAIVKREHRSGMHIFSYISAHMIYQAVLCLAQCVITIAVCHYSGVHFPTEGFITSSFYLDILITLFLITYAADMLSLMISCIVKNTTDAMTVMPLVLIVQLVLSGSLFSVDDKIKPLTDLTIARWGIRCLCTQANYNSLPMVSVWNQMSKFSNVEFNGIKPIADIMNYMYKNGLHEQFMRETGAAQSVADYVFTQDNVAFCWMHLVLFILLFAFLAMLALKFVDKDKR